MYLFKVSVEHDSSYAWNPLPTRADMIKSLQTEEYDVLVIGGGATGCGVAVDSVSRGKLKQSQCFNILYTYPIR